MISLKAKCAFLFLSLNLLLVTIGNATNLSTPLNNPLDTLPLDFEEEEEEIFMMVEEMPRFPGCEDAATTEEKQKCSNTEMIKYISNNLKYPSEARKNGVEGKVVVQFIVDKDGSIDDISLLRDIGSGCGEEAVRVVENMNKLSKRWAPGKQKGNNVRVKFTLPFSFKLSDDEKKALAEEMPMKNGKVAKDMEIFEVVDESPRFPGCEDVKDNKEREECSKMELLKYIYTNIKYPKEAREQGIDGTVIIQFVVTPEGYIGDIEAVQKVEGGCTEASIKVVKGMNDLDKRWIPGKQEGIPVHVQYTLPIKFKLEGESEEKKN